MINLAKIVGPRPKDQIAIRKLGVFLSNFRGFKNIEIGLEIRFSNQLLFG